KWPELYKKQTFEYLDTIDKGNYTQYVVRFKWTPNEWTEGYLLVPKHSKGKMPAVVTAFYDAETAIGTSDRNPNLTSHRFFALQLVSRVVITLSLRAQDASARHEFSLYYPSIDSVSVKALFMLGYAAHNA